MLSLAEGHKDLVHFDGNANSFRCLIRLREKDIGGWTKKVCIEARTTPPRPFQFGTPLSQSKSPTIFTITMGGWGDVDGVVGDTRDTLQLRPIVHPTSEFDVVISGKWNRRKPSLSPAMTSS